MSKTEPKRAVIVLCGVSDALSLAMLGKIGAGCVAPLDTDTSSPIPSISQENIEPAPYPKTRRRGPRKADQPHKLTGFLSKKWTKTHNKPAKTNKKWV